MKEEQVQGPVELLSIPEDAPEKDWYWVTPEYKTNPSKVMYFTQTNTSDSDNLMTDYSWRHIMPAFCVYAWKWWLPYLRKKFIIIFIAMN